MVLLHALWPLVLLAMPAGAKEPAHASRIGERYLVRHWSIEDGLPQTSVTGIAQSSDGYLWLATFGGIARFDGASFTVMDPGVSPALAVNRFVGAVSRSDGSVWFGVEAGGFIRYADGAFTAIPLPSPEARHMASGMVRDGDDRIWAAVDNSLVEVVGDGVTVTDRAEAAVGPEFGLATDDDGRLWVIGETLVACWSSRCAEPYRAVPVDAQRLANLARGERTTPHGPIPPSARLDKDARDAWRSILRWGDQVWFTDSTAMVSEAGRVELPVAHDPSLPLMLPSVFVDREGSLWLGGVGDGLFQVQDQEFASFGAPQGLSGRSVWGLAEDPEGRLWVVDDEGLGWLKDGVGVPAPPEIQAIGHIRAIAAHGEDVWLVTDSAIWRYRDGLHPEPAAGDLPWVSSLLFTRDGAMWIGGRDLVRIEGGRVTQRLGPEQLGAPINVLREAPDGALWIGTKSGVLSLRGAAITRLPMPDSIAGGVRDLLIQPNDEVWVGTYGSGLFRIHGAAVQRVGAADGLCENVVSRILPDPLGHVWMNGNRGVSRVVLDELRAVANGSGETLRCDLFDTGEGNGWGGLQARDGRLWFPTIWGVASVDPTRITVPVPPLVHLESAGMDDVEFHDGDTLSPGPGELAVRYAATGLRGAENLRFRHRLVGHDDGWISAGNERIARYVNLGPGSYRFEVQARGRRGAWSDVASTHFRLAPHVYQTPWFWALLCGVALVGGWKGMQLRGAALQRRAVLAQARITEQQRHALAISEARLRLILESSADGVLGLDGDGNLTFVNSSASAMLGRSVASMVGRRYAEVVRHTPGEGDAWTGQGPVLDAIAAGRSLRREGDLFWSESGSSFPVSVAMEPLWQAGESVGAVVTFRDVSAQVATERARLEALRAAERLARARSEFVANMSHEIRTPLTTVLGLAQVGARHAFDARDRRTFLGILGGGRHLLAIVDDVLDFSKIESGRLGLELGVADLGSAIDRAVDFTVGTAVEKGLTFVVEEAPELPRSIWADELRLAQVILNLLSNAVKFTERGGVRLCIFRSGGAGRRDTLVIEVRDTGIGMSESQIERAFVAFEQADSSATRRVGGTGLGLAITRALVSQMGGRIDVRSELGVGSVFTASLPIQRPVEVEPASGRIALIGMTSAVEEVLRARGLEVVPREQAQLWVVAPAMLADRELLLTILARVEAGGRVAILERAGGDGTPVALRGQVTVLNEPLRVRHIVSALVAPPVEPRPSARLAGRRVLIADDVEVNRIVLEDLLLSEGATPVSEPDGRAALERVRAAPGTFDVVLMDVQMPEMDGYEATARIRAIDPTLPIVGVTAHATPAERERCIAAGMVAHIAKPYEDDLLVRVVEEVARRTSFVAVIDWAELDARYPNRAPFVARLLSVVVQANADVPARLRAACAAGELEAIATIAHGIKGTAGNVAAASVVELADRVQVAARAGEADVATLAQSLAERFEQLLGEARARLPVS